MTTVGDIEVRTPNLDKISEVREESQAIGEFLEWLVAPEDAHGAGGAVRVEISVPRPAPCTWSETATSLRVRRARGGNYLTLHSCVDGEIHDNSGFTCTYCLKCKGTGRTTWDDVVSSDLTSDQDIVRLLAEYFGIDHDAAERERQAILDAIRS